MRRVGWEDETIGEKSPIKRREIERTSEVEAAAEKFGVDLSSECPVCRSLGDCECDEKDRTFARRVRFESKATRVPRCPRCEAPLSVLYLKRPGSTSGPPYRLAQFVPLHACGECHGAVFGAVAVKESERARLPS